jgi:hypothetical protein
VESAGEVDVEVTTPELVRGLGELRAFGDARVVDEDVGRAAEELGGRREGSRDRAGVGHVADRVRGRVLTKVGSNLPGHVFNFGGRPRDDEDARTLTREEERHRAPDAAPAARDESRPARESHK